MHPYHVPSPPDYYAHDTSRPGTWGSDGSFCADVAEFRYAALEQPG